MSCYRHLPVWKAAMALAVYLEHAVRADDARAEAAELTVSLGRQSGGWRRRVRPEASSQTSVQG